ncbi:unnamed protein product [Meganyctiphanes norvegica]|uniref:Uncharacterized protein n=1 Tax=Meganyctiphanes norvegica TaxID=48144 RepID=A0AAV2RZV2_MEGNR
MCTECLRTAIRERAKKCPKCRAHYSASKVERIPINFALESVMKFLNSKVNYLPECTEHRLPVTNRCSTHKAWICERCFKENHSSESCKIITISEELDIEKSMQIDESQPCLNAYEKTCKKTEERKKIFQKIINEYTHEIDRYESLINRFQEEIQRKKLSIMQMETFVHKLDTLEDKRFSYDKAVASLKSSESIRGVSRCLDEVQNEAQMLELISKEVEKGLVMLLKAFKPNSESDTDKSLGYYKISIKEGKYHLHIHQDKSTTKSIPTNLQYLEESATSQVYTGETISPMTDGTLTFMDISFPDQEPRRLYMKMVGNTARAKQHLLLVTGQYGYSYKDLRFYKPINKGQPGELLIIHPYDGKRAAPLVEEVTEFDVVEHDITAGLIAGAGFADDDYNGNNALFGVYLRDKPGRMDSQGFGQVTSGLEILQEIANSNKRDKIKVVDCGVVLVW